MLVLIRGVLMTTSAAFPAPDPARKPSMIFTGPCLVEYVIFNPAQVLPMYRVFFHPLRPPPPPPPPPPLPQLVCIYHSIMLATSSTDVR
jgi:hypothetical protein